MAIPDRDFGHLESSDGRMCGYVDRFGVERDMSGAAIAPGSRPTPGTLGAPIIGVGARGVPVVIAQSAIAASVTGTLAETTLVTIAIPAGVIGLNGRMRITTLWSLTNSANSKVLVIRFGGVAIANNTYTANSSVRHQFELCNRGAANSQVAQPNVQGVFSAFPTAVQTFSIDTSVAQSLTFTGTLTNTGETITLEAYTIEILNP